MKIILQRHITEERDRETHRQTQTEINFYFNTEFLSRRGRKREQREMGRETERQRERGTERERVRETGTQRD